MGPRPGVQIKFDPQDVILPPPIQNNFPGAKASLPHRGWWPDTDSTQGTASSLFIRDGFILGDFMFVWDVTEIAGVDLTPANWSILRISTGLQDLTTFRPVMDDEVHVVAFDGQFLYMAGEFTSVDGVTQINGQDIGGLVRFDWNDGGKLDTTWNPEPFNALGVNIDRLEVNPDKNTLYLAGPLLSHVGGSGGTVRNGIAEVSLTGAGAPTAWDANPSSSPLSVKYDAAIQNVYLGGAFVTVQGNGAHRRLVRMTTSGAGAVDATWLPDPDALVRTVLLDGARVFTGGDFGNIGATPVVRNRAAEIDNVGEATSWNPNVTGGDVLTMQKITEETLSVSGVFKDYVLIGGSFTTIGGTGRAKIGAVDIDTAALHEWDPNPGAPASGTHLVFGIQVKDRTAYVLGNYNGIASSSNKDISAVPFPIFSDANSKYVAKTGDDTGAGTRADPFLTIDKALTSLGGAFVYAVCLDSGTYEERIDGTIPADSTLIADLGQAPTISLRMGAKDGTYGARVTGRTKFSTGAFPSTFVFVSKAGDNGTGTRGDQSLPFLTITAALAAALDGDTIQIDDSGTYDGQLVVSGFTTITIQAKDGEAPLLTFNSGATGQFHVDAQGAGQTLAVYGLGFQTAPWSVAPNVITIRAAGPLNLFDCTFNKGAEIIQANEDLVVENCLFKENTLRSIHAVLKATITNSYFLNCGGTADATVAANLYSPFTGSDFHMDHCTLENPGFLRGDTWDAVFVERAAASPAGTDLVEFCDFLNTTEKTLPARGVHIKRTGAATGIVSTTVEDCRFADLGRQAIFFDTEFNGSWDLHAKRCVAIRCAAQATADEGTFHFIKPNTFINEDLVSIASGLHGFWVEKSDLTSTATRFTNCVALNSGGDGFREDFGGADSNTTLYQGCIESGSVGDGFKHENPFAGFTNEIIYCSFQRPIVSGIATPRLQGTIQDSDPKFISTVPRSENLALFADSPCVLSGNPSVSENMGFLAAIVEIGNPGSVIEGFIIEGPDNFYNGINVSFGQTNPGKVSSCTFRDLGQYAARAASGYDVDNCQFENKGVGVLIGEANTSVTRSVGAACSSAFIICSGNHLVVKNNTAYLCDFGQFDRLGAYFDELKNNVYSGNGQADYSGDAIMSNSSVGNLEGVATITNGTRLNPLFRDTEAIDLRLQTLDSGFFFDSPAKDLGDDGKDAGAFDVDHGVVSQTFTLVDLEADKGGGVVYRNPSYYTRKSTAIKLGEGTTHGGRTYSDASAFRREHVLTWEDNTDMPDAQVTDLEAIYTTGDGECELSFDGGTTFIPVRVVRGVGFEFTEIADANYNNDSLPTPVGELVFRDSA